MEEEQNVSEKRNLNEVFAGTPASLGTPWRLFVFSILLFGFSLFVYFGLKIGYENYLNSEASSLDDKINQLSNSVSKEDQQKFISIYSQIVNLQNVLNNHLFTFNIFNFLERNTLPQVFYSNASFSSLSRSIQLDGQAASLQVLAAQIMQFEKAPEVESAVLTSMNFNPTGNTSFSMNVVLKKDYLSKPL
jgi:hypothetical protein